MKPSTIMITYLGMLLSMVVVGHSLPVLAPTTPPTPLTTPAPPIHPPDGEEERIVVLPHTIHQDDPEHSDSVALQQVTANLKKKEPVVKGLLVDKNVGDKMLLIKPKSAKKVISLKNLPGLLQDDKKTKEYSYNSASNSGASSFTKSQARSKLSNLGNHSRQKRFLSLRNIALPLSIFHYLGFLPMRVPGLPYHVDPGLPDYTEYEPYNEIAYPDLPLRSRGLRRY